MTTSMFDPAPAPAAAPTLRFIGADYDAERDQARLTRQVDCICHVAIACGKQWWTVQDLAQACSKKFRQMRFPENSVQAQLRNLRRAGYTVERRNIAKTGVLYEYRVLAMTEAAHAL